MPYHIQNPGADILVVQFGLNDCNHWATDRGLPRVSKAAFLANLREIIDRGLCFGAKRILLNNNHPTSRNKATMPGASITYEDSNANYNAAIRKLAEDLPVAVSFQDIEAYFLELIKSHHPIEMFLLQDGLHLSIAGHEQYYSLMCPIIREAVDAVIAAREGAGDNVI
jgi:lysophospholipase L1-like esterase